MPKVLDFYADWCAPCKAMKPVFEDLEEEYEGKVEFESIDVEEKGALASKYQIMSIPTFVILEDDEEVARKLGAMSKEAFKSWLEKHI
jgi:thioredoxin 1